MSQERPAAVTAVVWLTGAVIALTGVAALLSIVFKGALHDAWASGREDAGSVEEPAIVPVAVVMLVVVGLLVVVLLEFFRARHAWARVVLTAIAVLLVLATLATLKLGPPAVFVVLCVVMVLLTVALLVALWHRGTSAYLRDAQLPGDVHSGS